MHQFFGPERYFMLDNCFSNLKKLTVQKLWDVEVFFSVFSKNISLIIEEVTPQDLHSVALVTICEYLKKLRKVEFKVDLTTREWCYREVAEIFDKKELAEIFDKNLQGTEVVVSTKHGLIKPLTFGQTSMFRPM